MHYLLKVFEKMFAKN